MLRFAKLIGRKLLRRIGYHLFHQDGLPLGLDFMADIKRLAGANPPRIIFDVGAHTGDVSLRAAEMFQEASIFAFEPNPKTFASLRRSLKGKANCENLALGD